MISKSLHLTPTNFQVKWISHHLTSKLKNKQIRYCFSTLEPQYLLKFSSKVTSPHLIKNLGDFKVTSYHPKKNWSDFKSPHLTSEKNEVISKSPHLTSKKLRRFQNHLISPQKNRGDFKVISPHVTSPCGDLHPCLGLAVPGCRFYNLGLFSPRLHFSQPGTVSPRLHFSHPGTISPRLPHTTYKNFRTPFFDPGLWALTYSAN